MDKSIEISEKKDKKKYNLKNNLLLGIDQNQRIIKFNKECEYLSGFTKTELLNKPLFGLLIPIRYENQWINVVKFSLQYKIVDNIKLPLLTKNGHEIMISWSSFPVKNKNGEVGDINLIGNLIKEWIDENESKIERIKDFEKRNIVLKNVSVDENSTKVLKQLQKINAELMKKNDILENTIIKLKKRKNFDHDIEEKSDIESGHILNKSLYSLSELFGGKKRKKEFDSIMHELDEREKFLDNKELDLINDKRKINEQMIEFKKWRKRLELLEEDIENRRKDLINQETNILSKNMETEVINIKDITDKDLKQTYDIFENISNSAVIIQRGIIRKINDNFTNLIGYNSSELIDKSLFDFISSEGFYEIEKYYLNRLKGEEVSFYNTIFLTKNYNKIPVEINVKPTFFNGEKAEMVIIKKLNDEEKIK